MVRRCFDAEDHKESSRSNFQPDADLSGIVFDEMNTGLLESFLYFEDRREISFHYSVALFNALQSRRTDPRAARELVLTPA